MGRTPLLLGVSVFWLGLSFTGDGLMALVLPVQSAEIASKGNEATVLGLVSLFGIFAGMAIQPLAGARSDASPAGARRRRTLTLGTAIAVVGLGVFAFAGSVFFLLISFVGIQVGIAIAQAGQQGFIPDLVPHQTRGKAAGLKGLMDVGGATIAFVVLGGLLAEGSVVTASVAMAGVLSMTLVATWALVREPRMPSHQPEGFKAKGRFRRVFHIGEEVRPAFMRLVVVRFLFLLGIFAVGRFLVLMVRDRLGLTLDEAVEQAAPLLGILALVTAAASVPAGWATDRYGRVGLMKIGALLAAIGVGGLSVVNSLGEFVVAGVFMALGSASFGVANWAMTADVVPRAESARYFGIANFGTAGAAGAAGVFGPVIDLGNRLAEGAGYVGSVGLLTLAILLTLPLVHRLQEADAGATSPTLMASALEIPEKGGL